MQRIPSELEVDVPLLLCAGHTQYRVVYTHCVNPWQHQEECCDAEHLRGDNVRQFPGKQGAEDCSGLRGFDQHQWLDFRGFARMI